MQKKTIYKVSIIATLVVLVFVVAPTAIIVAHVAPIVSKFNEEFSGLPDEERYRYINEVKDALDYKSSGKVVQEAYDSGPGVISPSYFWAEIEGEQTFELLTERLLSLPDVECAALAEDQTRCDLGVVDVDLYINEDDSNLLDLKITDAYSGRG